MPIVKDKLIYKHIVTYVLLLILPIIFFIVFMQISILEKIRKNFIYQLEMQVIQNAGDTENIFSNMDAVATDVAYNQMFDYEHNLTNVPKACEILRELQGHTVNTELIREVVVWSEGDNYVYTSSGTTYKPDQLLKQYPIFNNTELEEFANRMNTARGGRYTFTEQFGEEEALCYTSVYKNGKEKRLFLFFIIKQPNERNIDNFVILDKKGKILHCIRTDHHIQELIQNGNTGNNIINKEYLEIKVEKDERNYIQYFQLDDVMAEFQDILMIYHGTILVLLMIGGVLITVSIKRSLIPLLKSKKERADVANLGFLYQLLKGKYSPQEVRIQIEKEALEYLKGESWFILVFQISDTYGRDGYEVLRKASRKFLNGYLIELTEEKRFAYIGSLIGWTDKQYRSTTYSLWENLEQEINEDIAFSASALFQDTQDIQKVFIKTSLALEYRFSLGNSCYIDTEQLLNTDLVDAIYPRKLIEQLILCVKVSNSGEVSRILDEINIYIKSSNLPVVYAKGICYELVIKLTDLLQSSGTMGPGCRLSYSNIGAKNETVDELTEKIRNIANNICRSITEKKQLESENAVLELERFIVDNALLEKFSIQYMADYFDMSPSNLSNVYKQKTGITVVEHATRIRMKKAQELLLDINSKMTLDEIVIRIGYNNTSSFIRKFKTIFGVTPRQYTKLAEKQHIESPANEENELM